MKTEFVTAIWFASFKSREELTGYLEWTHPEEHGSGEAVCRFAQDIGVEWFDEDFLESVYLENQRNFDELVDEISFSRYFKDDLLNSLEELELPDGNAIIALSGTRNANGESNAMLFDFTPPALDKAYLHFGGVFTFEVSE